MTYCSALQAQLTRHFPKWRWNVVENANPSTSVIILSQGQMIPGEVIVSLKDDGGQPLGQKIVGGQAYCDYVKVGRTDDDFARDIGGGLLQALNLA